MGLFRWFIWSCFNILTWYLSRKLSILSRFSNFVNVSSCSRIWWFFEFPQYLLFCLPFHFWIFLIWVEPLCLLVIMAKCLSIFLIFLKNQLLFFWLFVHFFCFNLVDFSTEFDYFLTSTPLGCICFFFRCAIERLVYALSSFFMETLKARFFLLAVIYCIYKLGMLCLHFY